MARSRQNIESITTQADISCDIEVLTETKRIPFTNLDVDWFLQLKSQTDDAQLERRRERVQLQMRRIKGSWKIVSIPPVSVLDPIHVK